MAFFKLVNDSFQSYEIKMAPGATFKSARDFRDHPSMSESLRRSVEVDHDDGCSVLLINVPLNHYRLQNGVVSSIVDRPLHCTVAIGSAVVGMVASGSRFGKVRRLMFILSTEFFLYLRRH
jgi:hypothetical protein